MKNKILKKILASVLIIALTAGNLVLIGNTAVSYAVANLENQNEETAHENVKFGAYFESEGKKIHSLICDAKSVERLYIHLNVKQAGFLKNGKIQDVALVMRFPESKYMADKRKTLCSENNSSLSKIIERTLE